MRDSTEGADPEIIRLLTSLEDVPERDPHAAAAARARFLLEASGVRQTAPEAPRGIARWLRRAGAALPALSGRTAARVVAVLCVAALCVFAATGAARSLPGDALYPVKAAAESLQVLASGNGAAGAVLHRRLAERRLSEVATLADLGRTADVSDAVAAYAGEVGAATEALRSLSGDLPAGEAAALAEALSRSLSDDGAVLSAVAQLMPAEARRSLDEARTVTAAGVAAAGEALGGGRAPGGGEALATQTPAGVVLTATSPGRADREAGTPEPTVTAGVGPRPTADPTATPVAERTHGRPSATATATDAPMPAATAAVATGTQAAAASPAAPAETSAPTEAPGKSGDAPGHAGDATVAATGAPTVAPVDTATREQNVPPGQANKDATTTPAYEPPTVTPAPIATPVPSADPTATTQSSPGKSDEAPGQQKKE